MVGIAGSGKTTYVRSKLPGHAYVSMDELQKDGSWMDKRHKLIERYGKERPLNLAGLSSRNKEAECILADDALKDGRDVAVDDTNLTPEIRRPYVLLAQKHGAAIRAVFFSNTRVGRYRNSKRKGRDKVPDDAVTGQIARMERPTEEEGFDSILVMG